MENITQSPSSLESNIAQNPSTSENKSVKKAFTKARKKDAKPKKTKSIFQVWKPFRLRRLVYGLPVLIVFCLCLVLAVAVAFIPRSADRYNALAKEAMAKNDWNAALFYTRAALQLDNSEVNLERLSEIMLRMGDWNGAVRVLEQIIASNENGHYNSHLTLGVMLLQAATQNPKMFGEAEKHLQAGLKAPDETAQKAATILGELYLRTGRFEEAATILVQTSEGSTGRLLYAAVSKKLGDKATADLELEGFLRYHLAQLEKNPSNIESRYMLGQALGFQGNFDKAIETLNWGIALAPNEARLFTLRGQIYNDWLASLDERNSPLAERFALLDQALKAAPNNADLLSRLSAFWSPQSKEYPLAKAMLEERLAEGRNRSLAHFALGNIAWQQEKKKEALFHFEQAAQDDPSNVFIRNNLAFTLAASSASPSPMDLDRALTLIQGAVEINGNNAIIRQTRGMILFKLKRWKEAISDLEFSIPGVDDATKSENYTMLATAYRELGLNDIAEKYQEKKANKAQKP